MTVPVFKAEFAPSKNIPNPGEIVMKDFPEFMKRPENRIASGSQGTQAVEGYVFDGADGSQMAFWTCHQTTVSAAHVHDFDEYMIVVAGCYTLIIEGKKINVHAGEEFYIPRGLWHGGEVVAGTRTIHAFGGRRTERVTIGGTESEVPPTAPK